MTNITLIKTVEDLDERILLLTDSMGSNFEEQLKNDHIQKLYKSSDFLLVGTGRSDQCADMGREFMNWDNYTVDQVSESILSYSKKNFDLDEPLHFVVAGKEDNKVNDSHVICEEDDYHTDSSIILDGSSREIVGEFLNSLNKEKRLNLNNHLEGLSNIYAARKYGAMSLGVNDKIQLGIVSKNGVSTVYCPNILFNPRTNSRSEYLKQLTGVDLKNPAEYIIKNESRFREAYDLTIKANKFNEEFYHALIADLDALNRQKDHIPEIKKRVQKGLNSDDVLKILIDENEKRVNNAQSAYSALISKNPKDRENYLSDFQKRQHAYFNLFE